nr:thiol:disulfide interchange protein [Gammaproteobacteria bacterium]
MGPRRRGGKGNEQVSKERESRLAAWRLGAWSPELGAGFVALLLACLSLAYQPARGADDFLPPQEAYKYTVRATDDQIVVTWTIAPGYYLYKDKMAVASALEGVQLGEPAWPRGEDHEDEFFGRQEIYRGSIDVPVPVLATGTRPRILPIELKLQGCADAGLCYPPMRWKTEVTLPAPARTSLVSTVRSFLPSAGRSRQDEFLPPDEAFRFSASVPQPDAVTLTWVIADDYYLYKDRIHVATGSTDVQLGQLLLPKGRRKHDEFFGDVEVYYELVEATLPIARPAGSNRTLDLTVTYQGCAEAGLCYNPITKTISLDLPPTNVATSLPGTGQSSTGAPLAEQDRLAALIREGHPALVLATFFGLGVLLSLTPCVLPMIPILSGIIVGQGAKVTPGRGFALAFTYVQGMALTYAAAGAVFVLAFKQAPQAFFQQPWIVALFAALFVVLALAMFGVFTLQMPSALQTRLTNVSNRQKAGTFAGTFVMGALSALIVTACVAPAIIAALSVISHSGQIARGAGALYATGLGMGVPLLLVGASAGSLLPKVGPWMDTIKSLFGVLFLGVAIYLLDPLLPPALSMFLWAALALITGYWIFSLKKTDGTPAAAPVRAVGLMAVCYGVLLLVGAASGSEDPLQPLDRIRVDAMGGAAPPQAGLSFRTIKTVEDLERELAAASAAGRPVMLDFYADWCVSCKEMEKYTFPDPTVQAALSEAVLLKADVTKNDADDQALLKRFEIFGPPTIAFFGPDGKERKSFRLVGFSPPEKFRDHVVAAFAS